MDKSTAGFFITAAVLAAVVVATRRQGSLEDASTFALSQLIDPAAVTPIANDIPGSGDDFVIAAWDYVGRSIEYSYFASDLYFNQSTVACLDCMLPLQVAASGASNCVGKSALLTSILRNRYDPGHVYMAVGDFRMGSVGGHAWVVLKRADGEWYLLEATAPPPPEPWRTAQSLSDIYKPEALVNDQGMICYDPEMCSISLHTAAKRCSLEYVLTKVV